MRANQAGRNRATEVIDIDRRVRVRIRERIAHLQGKSFDQRITGAEPRNELDASGVGRRQVCRDFLDYGLTHIEVEGAEIAAKAHPEVDASRQHEESTGRNNSAGPGFTEHAAYFDRAVEMQDDQVIG